MDDTRTQQALDELADLFLSNQGPANKPVPAAPGADTPSTRDSQLTGPAPIRLGPKLKSPPPPPEVKTPDVKVLTVDDTSQDHDFEPEAGTPLHLHVDDPDEPLATFSQPEPAVATLTEEDPAYAVAVEAVILGNLPGLSGPWLTQYAQLLAQQEGPVAILHIDDDLIDLELVEPTDREPDGRGVSLRIGPGNGQLDPVAVLEALMDSPNSAPGTILVHVDPQNDERGLIRALALDDWTVMCGADDLAIVGGYGMLKRMVELNDRVAEKRVGLMVMGSDPKQSQAAAHKFQTAATGFLESPVQLLGWQKQMVPVNLRHLGRFEDVDAAWPRLAEWFTRCAASITQPTDPPAFQDRPTPEPTYQANPTPPPPEVKIQEVKAPQAPTPTPTAQGRRDTPARFQPRPRPEPPEAPAPPPEVKTPGPEPEPVTVPEPVAAQHKVAEPQPEELPVSDETFEVDEPNLVELLMAGSGALPGGIAMEARCPQQPNTQLMLDQAGRLHLLYWHESAEDGIDGLQPAMVDLLQARKWVREHIELLKLTQRQLNFDTDAEPVLHLFTDRADWATALAARLGDALKLHLLQVVQLGDQQAWFCTPLN